MTIAVRATSTGPNSNATSTTISLPTGTTTGDVTFLAAVQATPSQAGGTVPVFTAPSGWTVIANGNGSLVCCRAWQSGDPSSVTISSTVTAFWESCAISYTGVDTANPVDTSGSCFWITRVSPVINGSYRAPSVNPNWNGSQLLAVYTDGSISSALPSLPSGFTAQVSTSSGPNIRMCDKTLVGGTPTGDVDATGIASQQTHFGCAVAIKASGASAATTADPRPAFGALYNDSGGGAGITSVTVPFDHFNPLNGDMQVCCFGGDATITPPAGWTQDSAVNGSQCFHRTWSTGDPTTPTFTFGSTLTYTVNAVLLRKSGTGIGLVSLDVAATNSTSTGTVSAPSIAPSTAADLLLTNFGNRVNAGPANWTGVTAGLSDISILNTPARRFSSLAPSPNPSGSFSATTSGLGAVALDATSLLFRVSLPATATTGGASGTGTASGVSTGPAPYVPSQVPAGHGVNFNFTTSGYTPPAGHAVNLPFVVVAGASAGGGSAAGTGTAAAVGRSIKAGVGTAAGTSTASGSTIAGRVGRSAGTGTAAAVSHTLPRGFSAGTGTASGIGRSTKVAAGSSTGTGSAAAVGRAVELTTGSSAGTGTASAVGRGLKLITGAASGTGIATAHAIIVSPGTGSAAGTGTATAHAIALRRRVGSATGTGTASAIGLALKRAAGHAPGTSTANANVAILHRGVGAAAGTGRAVAIAKIIEPTVFFRSVF